MAITITKVTTSPPLIRSGGLKIGLVDITFDDQGPSWTITAAALNLQGLLMLLPTPSKDGYVFEADPALAPTSIALLAKEEADGAGAMGAADASDLNEAVARVAYIGY